MRRISRQSRVIRDFKVVREIKETKGSGNYTISATAPFSVQTAGDRWYDLNTGYEYVYINTGSASEWVTHQLLGASRISRSSRNLRGSSSFTISTNSIVVVGSSITSNGNFKFYNNSLRVGNGNSMLGTNNIVTGNTNQIGNYSSYSSAIIGGSNNVVSGYCSIKICYYWWSK
jgi:hypothetical protein